MPGMSGVVSGGSGGIAGSTGSTDNQLLRSDGTGGATLQGTGITVDDNNALSGAILRILSASALGNLPLTAANALSIVRPSGSGVAGKVSLPDSPTLGTAYLFCVPYATGSLEIDATNVSDLIFVGASVSSAGGTCTSSTRGSCLLLIYVIANVWLGLASGTWTPA